MQPTPIDNFTATTGLDVEMEEEDEESEQKEIKEDVSFSDLSDVPKLEAVDLNVSTASEAPKPVTFKSITNPLGTFNFRWSSHQK